MRARLNDTELYFDVDGSALVPDGDRMAERPVLFLLHGGPGSDHSVFKPAYTPLKDVAQLVYHDMRGCGRSAAADPQSCTLAQNIADLDALRAHLGVVRMSLLGSSYGGMVALGYALEFPDRLDNLILVATAPSYRFLDEARQIVQERGTPDQVRVCRALWEGSFGSLEQLHKYYRIMSPLYAKSFNPEKFDEGWGRGIRSFSALNRGFGDFLRTFDYVDRLHEIECPTLILAGAHDWICPPSQSRLMAEHIPRSHLKLFERSSHAIAADETEAFLRVVGGFLTYALR